ncbi:hypothetical protein AWC24_00335 [Mycolicibacter senuensis]|nr:hypothetical protein AWC24_00335 [Mycolicibacter senuensis]
MVTVSGRGFGCVSRPEHFGGSHLCLQAGGPQGVGLECAGSRAEPMPKPIPVQLERPADVVLDLRCLVEVIGAHSDCHHRVCQIRQRGMTLTSTDLGPENVQRTIV